MNTLHITDNSTNTQDKVIRFVTKAKPEIPKYKINLNFNSKEEKEKIVAQEEQKSVKKRGMDEFPEDVFKNMISFLLEQGKIRDVFMHICAANFGMRFSDVRQLKVSHLVDADGNFREKFYINEEKTSKTRPFFINEAVKAAMCIYWKYNSDKSYYDYLFTSQSNNKSYELYDFVINEDCDNKVLLQTTRRTTDKSLGYTFCDGDSINFPLLGDIYTFNYIIAPLKHTQVEEIIKGTLRTLGVSLKNDKRYQGGEIKLNTHSLRKMYGSVFMRTGTAMQDELGISYAVLQILQNDFMHTSSSTTQIYCSDNERVKKEIVLNMNIGLEVLRKYL